MRGSTAAEGRTSLAEQGAPLTTQAPDYERLLKKCFADAVHPGNGVFVADIPENKLAKAKAHFANGLSQGEKPLVLVDNTVFGSVKKGLLFTDRHWEVDPNVWTANGVD